MSAVSLISSLAVPAAVIGVLTFFIMAVFSQESKTLSRTTLVRSAFVHVVAFVALAMVIGSGIYLLQEGLRVSVLKKAQVPYSYTQQPPTLYLQNNKLTSPDASALKCDSTCEFSDSDKANIASWKATYTNWKQTNAGSWSIERKKGMIDAISMLIVGAGLFIWFFVFIAQRENRRLRPILGKPIALRTVYFYLISLLSLLATIVATTLLLNLSLKSAFRLDGQSTNIVPTAITANSYEKNGAQSIINCASKCGFTTEDQDLAKQWLVDYDAWSKTTMYPRTTTNQSDLANYLPMLLVTAPLFWYHFARIRREGHETEGAPTTPTTTS